MKFLTIILVLLGVQLSFAQETQEQVCSRDDEACALAYRVLYGLSKNQERGLVAADLNIRNLEQALNEGKVKISNERYQEFKSPEKKADYLFKEMLKNSDNPSFQKRLKLEDVTPKRKTINQLQSGTRGGGFELPSEWWLWF